MVTRFSIEVIDTFTCKIIRTILFGYRSLERAHLFTITVSAAGTNLNKIRLTGIQKNLSQSPRLDLQQNGDARDI